MKSSARVATILASASCLVMLGAGTGPSYADGAVSATGSNVNYVSDACFNSHVHVTGLDPTDEDGQDIEVYGPNGNYVDSDFAYGVDTEDFNVLLCHGVDWVGRYRIEVDNSYAGSFSVAKPYFVQHRTRKRTVAGQLKLRGSAFGSRTVKVQARIYGSWYNVLSVRTGRSGSLSVHCKLHYRCPQLYRFDYRYYIASPAFRLYTGKKNARVATTGTLSQARSALQVTTR